MRVSRLALPILCALAGSGCLQLSAVLKVNGDGSGTIVARTVVLSSALDRFRHFTTATGGDPVRVTSIHAAPGDSARRIATAFGVTFVSSTPILQADGSGFETTFAFSDISTFDAAMLLAALIEADGPFASGGTPMPIHVDRHPGGSVVLRAHVPFFEPGNMLAVPPARGGNQALEQQAESALVLDLLRGARVEIVIEPNGAIIRTNSPYRENGRVTLIEIEPERLVPDELDMKMAGARTEEEKRAVLADAGGMKIAPSPDVTIEFTPF